MSENQQVAQQNTPQRRNPNPNQAFGRRRQPERGSRPGFGNKKGPRKDRRTRETEVDEFDTQVLQVRRVTRVVKGGKRMRFSALVVVGDKKGRIGFGLKKGMDYQDSVTKATRQAKDNLITISMNENGSIDYPIIEKHKSVIVLLKPATSGTGIISGGFVRPVLELAGISNIYTKIIRSRNKIAGVQAVFKALDKVAK